MLITSITLKRIILTIMNPDDGYDCYDYDDDDDHGLVCALQRWCCSPLSPDDDVDNDDVFVIVVVFW